MLISPNLASLDTWARGKGLATDDRKVLVKEAAVTAEYRRIVDQVNKGLAHYETIKKITIVPEEWSVETGDLTPSMKLKRRVVEARYKDAIENMYRGDTSKGE